MVVVEAGTANSAFAKGGRCPTVRQPLSTWAPALHRTDEPLVLCQPFLIALIGRQRALSTPIREISGLPSLGAGVTLTQAAESFQWGLGVRVPPGRRAENRAADTGRACHSWGRFARAPVP